MSSSSDDDAATRQPLLALSADENININFTPAAATAAAAAATAADRELGGLIVGDDADRDADENNNISLDDALRLVGGDDPGSAFRRRLWLLTGLTQFADALELLLLAFLAAELRCPWALSEYDVTLLQTLVLLGMALGGNAVAVASDRWGRRPATILSVAMAVAGGLAASAAPSFAVLLCARFVVGAGVGAAPAALTLYVEFLPAPNRVEALGVIRDERRGAALVGFFVFFSVGALFEALIAWLTLSGLPPALRGWRALLLASVSPSVGLLACMPFWLPESPRWLLRKDTPDPRTALRVLDVMARTNQVRLLPRGTRLTLHGREGADAVGAASEEAADVMGGGGGRARPGATTVVLCLLFFLMAALYYSIVLLGTSITKAGGGAAHPATCNSTAAPHHSNAEFVSLVVTNGAELPGLFVAFLLLDRIGRKRTIQFFFLVCGAFCAALWAIAAGVSHTATSASPASNLMWRTAVVFGARGAALGFNQSLWIFTSLYYSTRVRTRGLGLTTSMARVGALLSPAMVNLIGGLDVVAGLCCGLALTSWAAVTWCLPGDR